MTKEKENAAIISQEEIAHGIYSMWIRTKAAETAEPGQFISMYTNDGSKLLPRPISICEIDKEKGALRVVYRVTDGRRRYDSCDRTVGKWIPAGESIRKTGVSHRGRDRSASDSGTGKTDRL